MSRVLAFILGIFRAFPGRSKEYSRGTVPAAALHFLNTIKIKPTPAILFGPSLTLTAPTRKTEGPMSPEDEQNLQEQIRKKFNSKYPVLVPSVPPNPGSTEGKAGFFFRYSISIGFHF
jgi:hypothetical protein